MRKLWKTASVLGVGIATVISFASTSAGADIHTILGAPDAVKWISDRIASSANPNRPLVVEVKKGDEIDILIPHDNTFIHGFVTINKAGDQSPAEAKELVQACGESKSSAVLEEIGCTPGTPSVFGKIFTGCLRLKVRDNFLADINFWCVKHTDGMWGKIKLKTT